MAALVAVCGLDCSECEIFRVPFDPQAARSVAAWFERRSWKGSAEVAKGSPLCKGCRGDRQVHWSADCAILKCCVDEKGLEPCSQFNVVPSPAGGSPIGRTGMNATPRAWPV